MKRVRTMSGGARTMTGRGIGILVAMAAVAVALGVARPRAARADDEARANRAERALAAIDLPEARRILAGADPADGALALARGRLALYEGDYDGAVTILTRPELGKIESTTDLLTVARGCARASAGTVEVRDESLGVHVRLQDEDDRPLVPYLVEVATAARATLKNDLGVDLPRPLRIELVRDHFALAEMTGLPESAARTTGTVAIAKWGRVTVLSPRAMPHGYPWADTLAHELTHMAQTVASADRAPLWLQEGVAKREETRWRMPEPLDDVPPADTVAAVGLQKGLGRPLDKIGGSIALLPSAQHAMVTFAEVTSFVRFLVQRSGEKVLGDLLRQLRVAPPGPEAVDHAMRQVTGASLAEWNSQWSDYLGVARRKGSALDASVFGDAPHLVDAGRAASLGQLLRHRGHHAAAVDKLGRAQELVPADPHLRHDVASELVILGKVEDAERVLGQIDDVRSESGAWYALGGSFARRRGDEEAAARLFRLGIQFAPFEAEVACQVMTPPDAPPIDIAAQLCAAARANPVTE